MLEGHGAAIATLQRLNPHSWNLIKPNSSCREYSVDCVFKEKLFTKKSNQRLTIDSYFIIYILYNLKSQQPDLQYTENI